MYSSSTRAKLLTQWTASLVAPHLLRDFDITQTDLDESLNGHMLGLLFTPKSSGLLGFLDINLYLFAGSDQIKKAQMLKKILSIDPHPYTFVSPETSTSSKQGRILLPIQTTTLWVLGYSRLGTAFSLTLT